MLRVRRVRVTLRVQAGAEGLRGANPAGQLLFIHPGPARQGGRIVPDQVAWFPTIFEGIGSDAVERWRREMSPRDQRTFPVRAYAVVP